MKFFTPLFIIITSLSAWGQAGTLDDTFNKTGIKIFDVMDNVSDAASAVAVQPDGKILVAGSANMYVDRKAFIARFLPNGSFDSTFHFDGIVTIDMSNEDWDNFHKIVVRDNGRILAVGNSVHNGDRDVLLAQFYPDGSLDPNFGSFGVTIYNVQVTGNDYVTGLTLLKNGKCLVQGGGTDSQGNSVGFLLRFDTNGQLDQNFGTLGKYLMPDSDIAFGFRSNIELPSGDIVIAANQPIGGESRVLLIGLTEDGQLNPNFGNNGTIGHALTTSQSDIITNIHLTPGKDKILLIGRTNGASKDVLQARFSLSGGLDVSFGTGGYLVTDLSIGADEYVLSSSMQPNGKLVIAGGINSELYVARFQPDGSLDQTFNQTGKWQQDLDPGSAENAYDMAIDPSNGRAIVAGALFKAQSYIPYTVCIKLGKLSTGADLKPIAKKTLQVFPNPARDNAIVQLGDLEGEATYFVLDFQGRILQQGALSNNAHSTSRLTLNCADWPRGQYIITVNQENKQWTGQLSLQ